MYGSRQRHNRGRKTETSEKEITDKSVSDVPVPDYQLIFRQISLELKRLDTKIEDLTVKMDELSKVGNLNQQALVEVSKVLDQHFEALEDMDRRLKFVGETVRELCENVEVGSESKPPKNEWIPFFENARDSTRGVTVLTTNYQLEINLEIDKYQDQCLLYPFGEEKVPFKILPHVVTFKVDDKTLEGYLQNENGIYTVDFHTSKVWDGFEFPLSFSGNLTEEKIEIKELSS